MAVYRPAIITPTDPDLMYTKALDMADNLTPEISPRNHLTTEWATFETTPDSKKIYGKSIVVTSKTAGLGATNFIVDTQLTSAYVLNVTSIQGSYVVGTGTNAIVSSISVLSPSIIAGGLQITVPALTTMVRAYIHVYYTKVNG